MSTPDFTMSTPDFAMFTPESHKMASSDQDHQELEALKASLFDSVMKRNWNHVVETYKTTPLARCAPITKLKDTALHIAVSTVRSDIAMKLLDVIYDKMEDDILVHVVNIEGNTPLHLAAAQGDLEVCKKIAFTSNPQVLNVRNNKGETPLFLAASNGKEKTFFFLHSRFPQEQLLRRSDGSTVLHMAIFREYFRMALKIIQTHPIIADSLDENGLSPLHILANKPNAFKRSTPLGLFDRILYYCQVVDIEIESEETVEKEEDSTHENASSIKHPENYDTCVFFIGKLQNVFMFVKSLIKPRNDKKENNKADEEKQSGSNEDKVPREKRFLPPNYDTWVLLFYSTMKALLIILGVGIWRINEIKRMKQQHKRAKRIMNELVRVSKMSYAAGSEPKKTDVMEITSQDDIPDIDPKTKVPSPILIAAKTGIVEMVAKILEDFPVAIQDVDSNRKNVVLLAVENRQPHVYDLLIQLNKKKVFPKENVFNQVDHEGNSALHLAANQFVEHRPWLIPGSALQMQWEIKWFEFVKSSMPPNFFTLYNSKNQTPNQLFLTSHQDLIKDGSEWLSKTSESCSVVAALVATVAFATSSAIPGGVKEEKGTPTLGEEPAFNAFAISSLIALCFSVTALVFFLSILTSRYQEKDFAKDLPRKLLLGLTSLFASIASMLVSFCAGHVFILTEKFKYVAYPLYAALCLPITFFAFAQLSLYFDLMMAIFKKVPQRNYELFQH